MRRGGGAGRIIVNLHQRKAVEQYLEQLNEQQREAVEYCSGPQLVIAGAGSGKTRVLTYIIVHLLKQGLPPYRIMALTFTNKAAREMRERIEKLVGEEVSRQLWMGTIHSIFARVLRINAERIGYRHDYTIYDTSDSRSLVKMIVHDMNLDDKVYKPATIHNIISTMKNALITADDYEHHAAMRAEDERAGRPLTYAIYRAYCERCRAAGAMDFDDLLLQTNILLRDNPDVLEAYQRRFDYVLVDEYQDTNFAQHMIVLQLTRLHNRLTVVGDDAQSIYSFRGANIDNILTLKKTYPDLKTFKLERNYRSSQTIVNAANSLIEKNNRQIAKHLYSENAVGGAIPVIKCFDGQDEAYVVAAQIAAIKAREGDSYEDFAVLYRTNAQSRAFEDALSNGGRRNKHGNMRNAIPYRIYGGLSFYERKEIKDAVCYMRLTINPDDDEALRRVVNYPARGIGATTLGKLQRCAIDGNVSLWQVLPHPQQHQLDVKKDALKKLEGFRTLIEGFARMNDEGADAFTLAKVIIERTRLLAIYMNDSAPENISRQQNITELVNAVKSFVDDHLAQGLDDLSLADFLAEVSLLTDQDRDDPDGEKVTLMTVHAAKGLEFKNVIIVGMEEDLFPSAMSKDSRGGIEEERRLMYVALTRAMKNCVITHAGKRSIYGQERECKVSRFVSDIDPQYLQLSSSIDSHSSTQRGATSQSRWPNFRPTPPLAPPRPSAPPITTRFTPPARPAKSATPPLPATAGEMRIHRADELSEGMTIHLARFGQGRIKSIDTSGAEAKIVVECTESGEHTLLLKYAKFVIV